MRHIVSFLLLQESKQAELVVNDWSMLRIRTSKSELMVQSVKVSASDWNVSGSSLFSTRKILLDLFEDDLMDVPCIVKKRWHQTRIYRLVIG